MSDTKNNHVVSQTYLRSFSCKEQAGAVYMSSLSDHVWCKPTRPIGIKKTCSFQDFYSIILDGSFDRNSLETQYKTLFEDNWSKVIQKLSSFPFYVHREYNLPRSLLFNSLQEQTLIKFLHHQYKKSPRMKAKVIQMNEKLNESIWEELDWAVSKNDRNREKTKHVYNHMTFTNFLKQSIVEDSGVIEMFIKKKNWILWINNTKTPFITTDMPVLWFDELRRGNIQILYAVMTPKFAIEIQKNSDMEERVYCLDIDEVQVKELNRIMKYYAFSKIVSNDKLILEKTIS